MISDPIRIRNYFIAFLDAEPVEDRFRLPLLEHSNRAWRDCRQRDHNGIMRQTAMLFLAAAASIASASGFRDEAIKCIQAGDFGALQRIADRPFASASLDIRLRDSVETAEEVDWSILLRSVSLGQVRRVSATGGQPFLLWLADHPDALSDYIHGGANGEVCPRSFDVWRLIWHECPESREDGPWRRFAIASALVQAQPINAMATGRPIDAVDRFRFYKQSADAGALVPSFFTTPVWKLRYVAGSWAIDSDLTWVRTAMKPEIRNQLSVGDACMMVPYIEKNAKGVSVQEGSKFYDDKPMTLKLMTEYGGVCGAIARFGASSCQALGVPSFPVAQPGHCAFVWENADSSWRLGNDVYGWGASSQHEGIRIMWGARPTFIPLYDMARRDEKAFLLADRLMYASAVSSNKVYDLRAAVAACPLFLPAWWQLVGLEPMRFNQAVRALGVSPCAVAEVCHDMRGDQYLVAVTAIADASSAPQLGTQTWATLEIVSAKLRQATGARLDVFAVLQCNTKRFKWSGMDGASQAIVAAAIKAAGSRTDITTQLEKLLPDRGAK